MCQIAIFNYSFLQFHSKEVELVCNSLNQFDGQGVAIQTFDGDIVLYKGAELKGDGIRQWLEENPCESAIWHSRAATNSPIDRDDLCQPFANDDFSLVLAHVGHVRSLDMWSIGKDKVSDGRMVFELANNFSDNPMADLFDAGLYPVAGYYNGKLYRIGEWYISRCLGCGGEVATTKPINLENFEALETQLSIVVGDNVLHTRSTRY